MRSSAAAPGLLLLGLSALLTSCLTGEDCEDDQQPHYTLSADQRAWVTPYPQNAVWRFANAHGDVRTYRVSKIENVSTGGGGSKASNCAAYQWESYTVWLERTDSVVVYGKWHDLNLSAAKGQTPMKARLQWAGSEFSWPLAEVEGGQLVLGPATFAGRTYPQVLGLQSAPDSRPWSIKRLYLTKTEGVIRFEERGGNTWDRL